MKRKILVGMMLATMIFSLTGCGSAKEDVSSGKSVEVTENKSSSNDDSKQLLKDAGWVAKIERGLGFYLPNETIYTDTDDFEDYTLTIYYVGCYVGCADGGQNILSIYSHKLDGTIISEDSIEFLMGQQQNSDLLELLKETDKIYLYGAKNDSNNACLVVYPKGSECYFEIYISGESFDDFEIEDDDDGEITVYEKGRFFTEETYNAFVDTLQYLGE